MNKRLLSALMIVLLLINVLNADSNQATLVLKAYKYRVSEAGQTKLFLVDSITDDPDKYEENLGYLGNGRNLDITPRLNSMLGDINGNSTGVPVFAYRVESNETGNFTIEINFEKPFNHTVDPSSKIGFKANMYNVAIDPTSAGTMGENLPAPIVVSADSSTGGSLSYGWSANSTDVWAVRGSVSMLVNKTDYESSTAYGMYQLNVEVTLKIN